MKASELRIGNIVKRTKTDEVFEVQAVDISSVSHELLSIDGIPITEEWLLKFGYSWEEDWQFEDPETGEMETERGNRWHIHKDGKSIGAWLCVRDNAEYYFPPVDLPVKYIHQLQNLYFALTSEELTIKE